MPEKSWKSKKNDARAGLQFDSFRNCFSCEKGACTRIIRIPKWNVCRRGFVDKEGKPNKMKIRKKLFQKQVAKKEGKLGETTSNN